ncbi:hypothetical protein OV079_07880 [Nannocystis pusilla]|uniref:Uncharacterized protein n=1 Tax=Nannocystis pusilla TaxID=889268 RepID=A0A9X3EK50_9BACT|nr:hypothetical protein [Nannocystis pusilla]MCY1005492.1 hypothetical protein [Nannocystis pusilla]
MVPDPVVLASPALLPGSIGRTLQADAERRSRTDVRRTCLLEPV